MKKKYYQKPIVEIDELCLQTALLVVSGGEATRTGYGKSEKQNWDDEEGESAKSNIWDDEL